jgi:SulP family sulfate permease
VVVDLTVAIEVGMVMAAFLFMKRMADAANIEEITREIKESDAPDEKDVLDVKAIPAGVQVYEINGPLFFGAVYKFKEAINQIAKRPKVRILRMRKVNVIDSSGLAAIEEVWKTDTKHGTAFIIAGIHSQPFSAMRRSGLLEKIGPLNVHKTFDKAVARANQLLSEQHAKK